jgi:hypothetical protein
MSKYGDTPEAAKAEIADLKRHLAQARLDRDRLEAQLARVLAQVAALQRRRIAA